MAQTCATVVKYQLLQKNCKETVTGVTATEVFLAACCPLDEYQNVWVQISPAVAATNANRPTTMSIYGSVDGGSDFLIADKCIPADKPAWTGFMNLEIDMESIGAAKREAGVCKFDCINVGFTGENAVDYEVTVFMLNPSVSNADLNQEQFTV